VAYVGHYVTFCHVVNTLDEALKHDTVQLPDADAVARHGANMNWAQADCTAKMDRDVAEHLNSTRLHLPH